MDVDCTDVGEVMTLLKSNIEHNLNRSSLTAKSNAWSGAVGKVRVQELDWLNDAHLANFTPPYDYIMLADCVYHEELIEALMKVILAMSNKKTVVLVANEYRSKSVHDRWMELCKTNFNGEYEIASLALVTDVQSPFSFQPQMDGYTHPLYYVFLFLLLFVHDRSALQ